ncbi:MAG: hydrogenase maturation protease [Acidimicrobiia bacterium]|nr:hydrogenase maturation protease [Acidimicrobiia bacterium]
MTLRVVVIGIGNPYRSDDGVAIRVLERLRRVGPAVCYVEHDGEASRLLDVWENADLAIVLDACRSGAPPGTIHDLDLTEDDAPVGLGAVSGHAVGLAEAVRLARALDRLPGCLRVVAVDVDDLRAGTELSPAVAAAVPALVQVALAALSSGRGARRRDPPS